MSRSTSESVIEIGVGIDTARYGHQVAFLRDDKQPAAPQMSISESRSGYERLQREIARLRHAPHVLSIWTSGNTLKALSQRLPTAAWFRVCQGPWVVISERLERLARAYGPPRIERARGPDNAAIVAAVRALLG